MFRIIYLLATSIHRAQHTASFEAAVSSKYIDSPETPNFKLFRELQYSKLATISMIIFSTPKLLRQRTGRDLLNMIKGIYTHASRSMDFIITFVKTKSMTKRLILVSVVFAKKDALNTTWRIALKDFYQLHTLQH
jgi:hypothetical protein